MKRKKYMSRGILVLMLAATLLSGCQGKDTEDNAGTKIVLTTGFEKDEIFRIEKASCTLPELMVYLMNTKNQYEEVFGAEIWSTSYRELTLEDNIKETVLAKIAKIKAMNLLAQEKGIALSPEEADRAAQAAAEYYASLSETEVNSLDVTQAMIQTMYEEYALADKVYRHLIADINPEISDDEARTITAQHILIKTYSTNEEGEKVPYTEQAKNEAYRAAREVWQRAKDGEDFTSLHTEYSEDPTISYSFGKGRFEAPFEEAAFNLGTGEISSVVETSYGYHVIKCISTFDREETDRNKVKIVEERRKEVFNEEYTQFINGLTRNLNEELWTTVGFIDEEGITTSSFFEVFQNYF